MLLLQFLKFIKQEDKMAANYEAIAAAYFALADSPLRGRRL